MAGSLFVAGTTAYAAVGSVHLSPGDTVAVSAAAGGVGTIAVQLARAAGATVIGIAGPDNDEWLTAHGIIPVNYGDGLAERITAAAPQGRVDAFLDLFGGGYVDLALNELGVDLRRIDTIIDFAAIERYGVQSVGNAEGASAQVLSELAALIVDGKLEVTVAQTFPLDEVRSAYELLERQHTRGKIVLVP
ncbi:putative oxidoreductase [Mycobacteroides abscessus subsp. abscessus]|nr:putative oxidoreductase [Mycobacteroides abscessus subsp. abscessus]